MIQSYQPYRTQEISFPMLDKADAVVETEPLVVACLFSLPGKIGEIRGSWRLCEVLPMEQLGPLSISPDGQVRQSGEFLVCGPLSLRLTRDEAQGYYLNLESPEPSFFCLLRYRRHAQLGQVPEVQQITLSYNQAARWMDGGERVERVAAPPELLPWLAEFAQVHFEVEGKKRKGGNRPSFMPRPEFVAMAEEEHRRHGDSGPVATPVPAHKGTLS